MHAAPQRRRDIDQRVKQKAGNPPSEQIVNSGLRYPAATRRFILRPACSFRCAAIFCINSVRALRFAACPRVSAIASHTLA